MRDVRGVWSDGRAVVAGRWHLRQANQVGERVRVWGRPVIHNGGRLVVGDRVRIVSTVAVTEIVVSRTGTLEVGRGSFLNYGVTLSAMDRVSIGAECLIGAHVMLMDNDFHCVEPERRRELPESAPIVVEDNVWLGNRVIVLGGVTIGVGSAVGAGSVVTHDLPPRSLAVGVPARVVRKL